MTVLLSLFAGFVVGAGLSIYRAIQPNPSWKYSKDLGATVALRLVTADGDFVTFEDIKNTFK